MHIDRTFHFIHFGDSDITAIQKSRIGSFRMLNPGYRIRIWRDSDFDFSGGPKFVRQCLQVKNYAYLSDYYRLVVLYENGGIYCDTDMECLKPLDPIISDGSLLEYEFIDKGRPYIGTAIMGFPKGHRFLKDAIDYYGKSDLFDGGMHINQFVITDLYDSGDYDLSIIPYDMHILYNMQEPGYHFTHHHADKTWQYQNEFVLYYDKETDIGKTIRSLDGKHIIICDHGSNRELERFGHPVIHGCENVNDAISKAIAASSAQVGYFFLTPGNEYSKDVESLCPTLAQHGKIVFTGSSDLYISKGKDMRDVHELDKDLLAMN